MTRRISETEAWETMLNADILPLTSYQGGKTPWLCRCQKCEREVTPRFDDIRSGQNGCKYCAGQKVDPDMILTTMRTVQLEPLEPYNNARTPWLCRCQKCEREVTPRFDNVRKRHSGCQYCAKTKIDPSEAETIMRASNLEPLEPYPGNNTQWRCRCNKCGNETSPRFNSVRKGHTCKYCAKNSPVNPSEAVVVMRAAGLEPLEPYKNARDKWRCRCKKCDNETNPRYYQIQQGGGGCIHCVQQCPRICPCRVKEAA